MNRPTIFLDLEQTIIDDWFSGNGINHGIIRGIFDTLGFEKNEVVDVEIFSWAIENMDDVEHFVFFMANRLEFEFNIRIVRIHTVQDVLREAGLFMNRFLDLDDQLLLGKERIFLEFCRATQRRDIALIDDVASNLTLTNEAGFSFRTINPLKF